MQRPKDAFAQFDLNKDLRCAGIGEDIGYSLYDIKIIYRLATGRLRKSRQTDRLSTHTYTQLARGAPHLHVGGGAPHLPLDSARYRRPRRFSNSSLHFFYTGPLLPQAKKSSAFKKELARPGYRSQL